MSRPFVSCPNSATTSLTSCSRLTSIFLVSARPTLENASRSSSGYPFFLLTREWFVCTDDSCHRAKKMRVFVATPSTQSDGEAARADRAKPNRQTIPSLCWPNLLWSRPRLCKFFWSAVSINFEERRNHYRLILACMMCGVSRDRPVIVGWSTAPRGQVINESFGQLPKKLAAGPRVLARTESSAPIGDETGWTTARSLREVGTTSVHSKPVFACNDCTFLDGIIAPPSRKKQLHLATPRRGARQPGGE